MKMKKKSKNCQKIVKKLSGSCRKVVKKLSKSCQKEVKKMSKSSQSCQKNFKFFVAEELEEEEEEEDNWYSLDQVPSTSHLVKREILCFNWIPVTELLYILEFPPH
jgi:hypothetical protein